MGSTKRGSQMSALDEVIARDAAPQAQNALSSVIANDAAKPPSQAPMTAPPVAQAPASAPGYLASLGQGISHGFGSGILGAQQLIGHGLQAIGADGVGTSLLNDANQRIQQNDQTYAPYAAANPKTAMIGDIGGNILATL